MTGSMVEAKPGTWRLRVVDGYDAQGRPHQLSKTVKGTKKQAEKELAKFVSDVGAGDAPTSGALSFGDYLTVRWLPHVAATKEPTTLQTHKSRAVRITKALGHKRLAKLSAHDLDVAYRDWGQELQASTVKALAETVAAALEQAVKWGMVGRNVAKFATKPRVAKRRSTMPSLEQIAQLVEAADSDPVLAVLVQLAARTGMRRGELCGLRWRDLDTGRMVLNVENAVKHVTGGTYEGETKTHRNRRFSIDAATVEVLKAHREVMATVGRAGDDDFLFTWMDRKAVNPNSVTKRFMTIRDAAGVECRFHDLRHAVATHLLSNGVDVVTASRRLGNTPRITLETYAHALEEQDRAAAGIMGWLLDRETPL